MNLLLSTDSGFNTFLLFWVVSLKDMHPHFGSSLLAGQRAEEIFSSGPLEVLEVKIYYSVVLTVPRINTHSKLPHVVFIFNKICSDMYKA